MKNKLAAWIVLGLIAFVAALCLSTTNEITKDIIAEQDAIADAQARQDLLPGAQAFELVEMPDENAVDYCYSGVSDGKPVGYVAQVTVDGYGGPVEVTVGTDLTGTINGIQVGGSHFAETTGLGSKARDEKFTSQFAGKKAPLEVGETIDAITAATITSRAVVRGVNEAVTAIGGVAGFEIAGGAQGGALGDGRYSATARGFGGPVYVELLLDAQGVIQTIKIGDDKFAETAGYGQKALEPAFSQQFVGKSGSVALGEDVDAISGATITSKAVVEAVNLALLYHSNPEAAANAGKTAEFVLPEVPEGALTASAVAQGFDGPVEVAITVDAAGEKLLRIEIGGDGWSETDGLGSRVKEPDFWHQFINKAMPIHSGDIDVVSGATITSKAVIEAVNKAYVKLFPEAASVLAPAPTEAPVAVSTDPFTATGTAQGYDGPVTVELTIDAEGKIAALIVGDASFSETEGLGAKVRLPKFVAQFTGKALPLKDGDIDMITGATVSSKATMAAVNKAYEKLAAPAPAPVATGNTATGTAQGYDGPVTVELTIDAEGKIAALVVGDASFSETEGLGAKVRLPEFAAQFIGKALPLKDGDIDMITGATVSSKATMAAVNKAYEKLAAPAPAPVATGNTATGTAQGYDGPVTVELTIDAEGKIAALVVGDASFSETEGLGAKVRLPEFVAQFIGKALPLKDGDIDMITGATVSSKATMAAVNKAYEKLAAPAPAPAAAGNTATGTAQGYDGPVTVELTIDAEGKIAALVVGDASFSETEGLGAKVRLPEFVAQFTGKALPLKDGDIDMITGATVSSKATMAAVNKAYEKLAAPAPAPAAAGNTATGTAQGYDGPVTVELTIDAEGKIAALVVGDASFSETEGLGAKVRLPEFVAQFTGKALPLKDGDIDMITGATVSSKATMAAVNKAYEKLLAPVPAPVAAGNTATGTAQGYDGPVTVELTIDAEGKIAALVVGDASFSETEGLGAKVRLPEFAEQFIGKALPLKDGDIDMITGATVSSKATMAAVNKAYEKLLAQQ